MKEFKDTVKPSPTMTTEGYDKLYPVDAKYDTQVFLSDVETHGIILLGEEDWGYG